MGARAVVLDFFGTLARATTSVGIDEILARHGHTISEQLQEMWWSGDIDGTEHVEQSRSREHYLAWQRERLVAMLHEADVHPGQHEAILADLQAGRAVRVLEAYDEVPAVLRELRDRGLRLLASVETGAVSLSRLDRDWLRAARGAALLIGNEGAGVPGDLAEAADARVRIPTAGHVGSLNAAVAAGICCQRLRELLDAE